MQKLTAEYNKFAGTVCNAFGKDWDKARDQVETSYQFLGHIPDEAWRPMTPLAVDHLESWPKNFVKSVKEVYSLWKTEARIERNVTNCEYCNDNGYFSGVKYAEVKPSIFSKYSYTWRCSGCRNWFGILGDRIPKAFPLEIKSQGFKIELYGKPMPKSAERKDLLGVLESVGQRVNPKTDRPEYMPYREPGEEG
jgi:hypothetical protein